MVNMSNTLTPYAVFFFRLSCRCLHQFTKLDFSKALSVKYSTAFLKHHLIILKQGIYLLTSLIVVLCGWGQMRAEAFYVRQNILFFFPERQAVITWSHCYFFFFNSCFQFVFTIYNLCFKKKTFNAWQFFFYQMCFSSSAVINKAVFFFFFFCTKPLYVP